MHRPGGTARRVAAVLAVTISIVALLVSNAGAGPATVDIAPTDAPAGTPMALTVNPADACAAVGWSVTFADPAVALDSSEFLAYGTGPSVTVPALPATIGEPPAEGYRLFLGIACYDADLLIRSVACTPIKVLPAGAAPTGSKVANLVDTASVLDDQRDQPPCQAANAVPTLIVPGQFELIKIGITLVWQAVLAPVSATTTTTTTLKVPTTTSTIPVGPTTTLLPH